MVTIERYKQTRFWAVYEGTELVCVTVYKRGPTNLCAYLERLTKQRNATTHRALSDTAATAASAR